MIGLPPDPGSAPVDVIRPLGGIRVLDFTHVIAGPYATQVLADLGAAVDKVESISPGDVGRRISPHVSGLSHYFAAFNRNKRSIALDLKSARGLAIAKQLAARADVVVENFAPGAMERLGLGYRALAAENPGLIYCSISGFGGTGPLAERRSFDLVTQAYAGVMSTNGEIGQLPMKVGIPIGDTGGSLFAVIAIMGALMQRRNTGGGQRIDLALYDCLLALLSNHGGHQLATGRQPERVGSSHYFCVPYGMFPTGDGHIVIAIVSDDGWRKLSNAVGLPINPEFARMEQRVAHREAVTSLLGETFAAYSTTELVELLSQHEVPCGPVNSIGQAFAHPQTAARNMLLDVTHEAYGRLALTALPVGRNLVREHSTAPPLHGEHSQQVLREAGYDETTIADLLQDGIIGQPQRPDRGSQATPKDHT